MSNPHVATPRPPPGPGSTLIVTLIIIVMIVGVGVWYWSDSRKPHTAAVRPAATSGQVHTGAASTAPGLARTATPAKTAPAR